MHKLGHWASGITLDESRPRFQYRLQIDAEMARPACLVPGHLEAGMAGKIEVNESPAPPANDGVPSPEETT